MLFMLEGQLGRFAVSVSFVEICGDFWTIFSIFTTFKNIGCGMHLDSIFANIKVDQRCFCGYEAKELEVAMTTAGVRGPYPKRAGGAGCVVL